MTLDDDSKIPLIQVWRPTIFQGIHKKDDPVTFIYLPRLDRFLLHYLSEYTSFLYRFGATLKMWQWNGPCFFNNI